MTVLPVSLEDYETRAAESLTPGDAAYLFGGSADEITLRENRRALDALRLWPSIPETARPLARNLRLLGQDYAAPLFVAPVAYQRLFHPQGEIVMAQAAAAMGAGFMLSTLSSIELERVRAAGEGAPQWFQLYLQPERVNTIALLRRAEEAGYSAVVVTVDATVNGLRNREIRTQWKLPDDVRAVHVKSYAQEAEPDPFGFVPSWTTLEWLRAQTRLPLIVKGLMKPADAQRAFDIGAEGIVVSNHGGRILDTAPASVDCLQAVCERVGGRGLILVDGGVRRGTDIVKCLALGAHAVCVGRPFAAALKVGGAASAAHAIRLLMDEFAAAMIMCGVYDVGEIGPDLLAR